MKTIQKSLRVPEDVAVSIEEMAEATRRDFSSVTNELLSEAVRMRRCPGIIFADGPSGRRPRVAGTGLDVSEVVAVYRSVGRDWKRLRKAYDWLTEAQLRAALGYYSAFMVEIDRQIARNEAWTADRLGEEHPALSARAIDAGR